jgi:hypothetical protein
MKRAQEEENNIRKRKSQEAPTFCEISTEGFKAWRRESEPPTMQEFIQSVIQESRPLPDTLLEAMRFYHAATQNLKELAGSSSTTFLIRSPSKELSWCTKRSLWVSNWRLTTVVLDSG